MTALNKNVTQINEVLDSPQWIENGDNIYYPGGIQLGSSEAPAIKQKLITGTTGVAASLTSNLTNIAKANIISFTVLVNSTSGKLILPSYGASGTDAKYYSAVIYSDGNLYIYLPSTSTEVAECAFTCLITYTA